MMQAENAYDTIVIGAGAAGLAAAGRIARQDRKVLVLEARERIGGRIQTSHLPGWPVPMEAGAEFIHGQPNEIWDGVQAANLAAYEVSDRHWHSINGRLEPLDFGPVWDKVFHRLPQVAGEDISFSEFLQQFCKDLSAEERVHVTAFVEGFNAADSHLISSRWVWTTGMAMGDGGHASTFRIQDGYSRIAQWLLSAIPRSRFTLRLNTVASAIHWQPHEIEVEPRSKSGIILDPITARHAIVTVPLGVLRATSDTLGAVRFIPDLAKKWASAERLRMDSVIKIVFRFREPFWENTVLGLMGFLHAPDEVVPTWFTTNPMRTPILTGWLGGPAAERLAGFDSGKIFLQAIDSLARVFQLRRGELGEMLQDWHVFNWTEDRFARGA